MMIHPTRSSMLLIGSWCFLLSIVAASADDKTTAQPGASLLDSPVPTMVQILEMAAMTEANQGLVKLDDVVTKESVDLVLAYMTAHQEMFKRTFKAIQQYGMQEQRAARAAQAELQALLPKLEAEGKKLDEAQQQTAIAHLTAKKMNELGAPPEYEFPVGKVKLTMQDGDCGQPQYMLAPIMTLEIDSPGGSIQDGMRLINKMHDLQKQGVLIKTVCVGQCASMGAAILAAGSKGLREAKPLSRIMLHSAAYGLQGKTSDILGSISTLEDWLDEFYKLIASYTDLSAETLLEFFGEDDVWLEPKYAAAIGLIDIFDGSPADKEKLLAEIDSLPGNTPEAIKREIRELRKKAAALSEQLTVCRIKKARESAKSGS